MDAQLTSRNRQDSGSALAFALAPCFPLDPPYRFIDLDPAGSPVYARCASRDGHVDVCSVYFPRLLFLLGPGLHARVRVCREDQTRLLFFRGIHPTVIPISLYLVSPAMSAPKLRLRRRMHVKNED